jgi:hypothetical protein
METPVVSIASVIPPDSLSGKRNEVASGRQSIYKSTCCRFIRLLAWLGGIWPAFKKKVVKTGQLGLGDMAAQDNTDSADVPWIPDHQMVRKIAEGAFGEVWMARSALGAYRAVKIVRRSRFDSDRPFQREFEGIQSFDRVSRSHSGFVNILHVGRNGDQSFFYIMELADDLHQQQQIDPHTYIPRTVSEEIKNRGALPLAECLQTAITLSDVLAHLHRQGLVHRDIKPSNIIYINGTVRLADVGLVADVREPISPYGTPPYIPEEGPGTVAADIFALGCVLYQVFSGNSIDQFPTLPTSLVDGSDWPQCSRLNQVILKACAADPAHRYPSAEHLKEALVGLQGWRKDGSQSNSPVEGGRMPARPRRVTLLYKANSEPDSQLMQLLNQRFLARGMDVYVDRHLAVGMDWAREIENKIRRADAVVILLSAASMQSEMLAYELEVAHQAAQLQKGRPTQLVVRIQYGAPWPEPLQPFLDATQPFSWNGREDNEKLAEDLARALESTERRDPDSSHRLESAGGAVALASRFYVVRPTDEAFRDAVMRWESIVLVKGARQMGKTSLLARGLDQARQAGARVALSDFQKLSLQNLESADSFYLAIAGLLADQLELDVLPQSVWNPQRSPNINFERFLRREVLGKFPGHLVWGLDEVDRLFGCKFGSEVFGLFRSWHNGRALDPNGPWSRLTLAIAYATEAHLFITDVNQSPFNVGTRVDLDDFTISEVMDLNERHGAPLKAESELPRFHQLVGGQPYLVRRALNELADGKLDFDTLVAEADGDDGIFGDHLRRILVMLARDAKLTEVIRGALQGQPCPDLASFYRLRSAGLMRGDSLEDARLRCEIYGCYLKRHV